MGAGYRNEEDASTISFGYHHNASAVIAFAHCFAFMTSDFRRKLSFCDVFYFIQFESDIFHNAKKSLLGMPFLVNFYSVSS